MDRRWSLVVLLATITLSFAYPPLRLLTPASHLLVRLFQQSSMHKLDREIANQRVRLAYLPQAHAGRANALNSLANALHSKFQQMGGMSDLDEAITLHREALELCPEGHPRRSPSLINLAAALWTRFQQVGGISDLDEAAKLLRGPLESCPEGSPYRSSMLIRLAVVLQTRFKQVGGMSDLHEAITLHRSALRLCSEGHPSQSVPLINLAEALRTRYEQLGEMPDLEDAIELIRRALQLCPEGHPLRAGSLINLAVALQSRFQRVGDMSELDEAIKLLYSALGLCPEGHLDRPLPMINLAEALQARFKQVGRMSDLDQAIKLLRRAVELCPKGHPLRSCSLINLAAALGTRFQQVGDISGLGEAIELQRNALEVCPEGHPNRSSALMNLAVSLRTRFNQVERLSDLDEAIALHRMALDVCPEGQPLRIFALINFAEALRTRFEQVGGLWDLDEAIKFHRNALELHPEGHPNRALSLIGLAATLRTRFKQLRETSNLNEAIMLHRSALDLCPEGHPLRSSSLTNLAEALQTRFEQAAKVPDLDEAIALYHNALTLRPQGHPNRSTSVQGIARCLLHHPQSSEQSREEAFKLFSTLSDVSQSVLATDLDAAQAWAQAAEVVGHHTVLAAYQTSLRLLATHLAILPCSPRHLALLKKRASSLAMDAFSASIRYGTLANAIELLEQGRGVFWSQLTRLRSPVDEVIASSDKGRLLGGKFLSISRLLRNILDSDSQLDRAWQLTNELRETVDSIRQLPDFSRFLLPTLFSDIQSAASEGPVVIVNSSQYSCDALIVFHERDPVHIPLQIKKEHVREWSSALANVVEMGKDKDVQRELVMILRELWDQVVYAIVQVLEQFCPRRSRVWWCPTAEFSLLPLHAAGEYRKNKPNFSDLYISSYTPTLTALIRARRALDSTITGKPRFVAIGNGATLGEATLVNVHGELLNIREHVHTNATFTCIEGEDARVERVGKELQESEFVHFACHGIPNPAEPFESGFALSDGLLKIQDTIRYDLQRTRLATLSACHATVGDKDSPDEAIHLAAAMQFIGFRSVVGTMWAVDDEEAKKVMTGFYRIMVDNPGPLDHTRAAFALHKALSVAKPPLPLYQRILFVHIGA